MKKKFSPSKFMLGISMYVSINIFIGYVLYPFIILIYKENIIMSIIAIFLVSISARYSMIIIYDHLKEDWLFIEEIKNQEKNSNRKNKIIKKIEKYKAISNIALTIFLVMTDSVVTVLYYRPGSRKWNGLENRKTKILFFLSNILGALIAGLGYNFIFFVLKKIWFF